MIRVLVGPAIGNWITTEPETLCRFLNNRMYSSRSTLAALILACSLAGLTSASEPVEGPPLLFSNQVIPEELRAGERFEVAPICHVVNFGYEFRLNTDWGVYEVRGLDMLRKRIHEVAAMEKLEEIGKTKAFVTSFSEALKDPVVNTWSVAKRPIKTVRGIPGGVMRYLKGKFYEVRRGSEKVAAKAKFKRSVEKKESEPTTVPQKVTGTAKRVGSTTRKLGRRHLGFEKAKRAWSRRLKVDPYTTNEYLQVELERIAWASSVGSFAGEFAIPSSAALSYALQAQEMVWTQSPTELERLNFNALSDMGVDHSALLVFNDLDHYTLSEKTLLVLALESLEVNGRLDLARLLLEIESRDEAMLMVKIVSAMGNYHRLVEPIAEISIRRGMATANLESGRMILPLALDYLHWEPAIAEALLSDELQSDSRTLLIEGKASAIAKRRLKEASWKLEESSSEQFAKLEETIL